MLSLPAGVTMKRSRGMESTSVAGLPIEPSRVAVPMNLPWVESPFFEAILPTKRLSREQERLARQYHQEGYVVLENAFSTELAARIVAETAPLFTDAPDGPRSRYRVQDGWRDSEAVQELASNPRVLNLLQLLYGRAPFPFQTLNFRRGSQQAGHSDQIHFSSIPARYMCGAWAALEDVDDANGPLFYFPRSHRLPEYDLYDIGLSVENPAYPEYEKFVAALMAAHGFEARRLHVRRGNVLIWSSNIVHGGTRIADPARTRQSQVTHYYFADCIYYTPVCSNRTMGEYALREDIIDIRTGERVRQSYNGRPFRALPLGSGRKFIDLGTAGAVGADAPAAPGDAKTEMLQREIDRLRASVTYRVGQVITAPLKLARSRVEPYYRRLKSMLP